MKLKFYPSLNVEKFARLVKESCGKVLFRLSDNSLCDLKEDEAAVTLVKEETAKGNKVEIYLTNMEDCAKFTKLMIGTFA